MREYKRVRSTDGIVGYSSHLSYIVCNAHEPDPTPHADFLNDYVAMAPLDGDAFVTDAAEVHTYLVSFTSRNLTAEAKLQTHMDANNG